MFNIINIKNMKVLAYKISTLCLLAGSISLSAQGKVGINTENPAYTLDVNGTVRVNDIPNNTHNPIMLGWDKTTGQVVQMPTIKKLSVFDKQEIYIPVAPRRGKDGGNEFFTYLHTYQNLNIDSNVYFASLLSATLVAGRGDDESPVAMKIVSIADKNTDPGLVSADETWTNRITNVRGFQYKGKRDRVGADDATHILQGTTAKTLTAEKQENRIKVPFFYETPLLELAEVNGRWYFRGEYDFSAPLVSPNTQLYWKVDVFLIKRTWMKKLESRIKITVSENNTTQSITAQKGNYPIVD